MRRFSIEPRTRKYVQRYGFLSFSRKYVKQLLDTRLDPVKTNSKKVVHKASKFLENKIADAVTKSNDDKTVKKELVEEIIIPAEKERWNINQIEKKCITNGTL